MPQKATGGNAKLIIALKIALNSAKKIADIK
jgi:hypothetical protein